MLYEANGKIYVYANNKYYEIDYKNNSLVPTTIYVLTLENAAKITAEEAEKKLSGKDTIKEISDEIDGGLKLSRRYKDR